MSSSITYSLFLSQKLNHQLISKSWILLWFQIVFGLLLVSTPSGVLNKQTFFVSFLLDLIHCCIYTIKLVFRPVQLMLLLRDLTLSSAQRPTRSCFTTRKNFWIMETSGRQRLLPTLKLTIFIDKYWEICNNCWLFLWKLVLNNLYDKPGVEDIDNFFSET